MDAKQPNIPTSQEKASKSTHNLVSLFIAPPQTNQISKKVVFGFVSLFLFLGLGLGLINQLLLLDQSYQAQMPEVFEESPATYPVSIHQRLTISEPGDDTMMINKTGQAVSVSETPLENTGTSFTSPLFVRNWTAGNLRQWTQYMVANPGTETATVTFKVYSTEGAELATITKSIEAGKNFNSYNDEDFISIPKTKDAIRTLGWVKITSDKAVSVHQRLILREKGNDNSTKDSDGGQAKLSTETPLADTATSFKSPLFLRNWTHGSLRQWNQITIANPGDEAVAVTFKIRKPDGTIATEFTKDLPAKGWFNSYNDADFNAIPPTSDDKRFLGWMEIDAASPVSIHQRLTISEPGDDTMMINKTGQAVSVSETPLENTGTSFTSPLFVRNWTAGDLRQWTQYMIANPGTETATLTFKVYSTEGAELATITKSVEAGQSFNSYNDEDFISIPKTKDTRTLGWVKITSDKAVSVHQRLILREKGDDDSTKDSDGGQATFSTETPLADTATSFKSPLFLRNWTHGSLRQWNQITIANPGDEAVAVTFKIYKSDGTVATEFTKDLPAYGWFNSYNDTDFNAIPPTSDDKRFLGWMEISTAKSTVDFGVVPLRRYSCESYPSASPNPYSSYLINDRNSPSQYTWITSPTYNCSKDNEILGYGLPLGSDGYAPSGTKPLYFLNAHLSCGDNKTVLMTTKGEEIPYYDGNTAKPSPLEFAEGCNWNGNDDRANPITLGNSSKPVVCIFDAANAQPSGTIPLYRKYTTATVNSKTYKYFMVSTTAGNEVGKNNLTYKEDTLLGYIYSDGYQVCTPGATQCSSDNATIQVCSSDGTTWQTSSSCSNNQECVSGVCQDVEAEFTLNLDIDLEARSNDASSSVYVKLKNTSTGAEYKRDGLSANSSGQISNITFSGITAGTYKIYVKPRYYLSKVVEATFSVGETKTVTITNFLAGDLNDESFDKVNSGDYSEFIKQYANTGSSLSADFNDDEIVNSGDYSIFLRNYSKNGEGLSNY
ncbi:hypothetical protein GYA49_04395 [Candidatus Beckwithbacteria bacterium]|nr:hypothetical protein [Candidatus Beckwithbacteria bacterium]